MYTETLYTIRLKFILMMALMYTHLQFKNRYNCLIRCPPPPTHTHKTHVTLALWCITETLIELLLKKDVFV